MAITHSTIGFEKARKKIATAWLLLSGLIFLIFVFWTFSGKFGDRSAVAWGWVLPNIMPTLSLIVGILVMDAKGTASAGKTIDRFIYRLAFSLSLFYLLLILMILIFHGKIDSPLFTIFDNSSLFLGPLQGLVSAAIGAFYYKKR